MDYNTYNNIVKLSNKFSNKLLNESMKKYRYLNNISFRNCMFHYDISENLSEDEIIEEMYFGIIYKYFNINEDKFIKDIDEYMNSVSEILESITLRDI